MTAKRRLISLLLIVFLLGQGMAQARMWGAMAADESAGAMDSTTAHGGCHDAGAGLGALPVPDAPADCCTPGACHCACTSPAVAVSLAWLAALAPYSPAAADHSTNRPLALRAPETPPPIA